MRAQPCRRSAGAPDPAVPVRAFRSSRIAPSLASAGAVESLLVDESEGDVPRLLMPCTAPQLVVRFAPSVRGGLDVAAIGPRPRAHRKVVRGRQRVVMARLRLGAATAVLGVPAPELAGKIVMLSDLWGERVTSTLSEQLRAARDAAEAAAIVDDAIAARVALGREPSQQHRLVQAAAEGLARDAVSAVATTLGMSERSLRRVFQQQVGMSPKAFAQIARFQRALLAARSGVSWARVAADTGYYDQAHLIAEFRAITGLTPSALLGELSLEARESVVRG